MASFRWHVFLANLDPVIGSEQGKTRPVLVISEDQINQILPVVNVLPITSRKVGRKGLSKRSFDSKRRWRTNKRIHSSELSNPNLGQKTIDKEGWED